MYSEEYGTAAFWISENGDEKDEFYVYGCYYLGNNPWKTHNNQIYKGDDVILYGKITNYKGIPEMATKENYMYSHNGRTYSSSGDKDSKPGDKAVGYDTLLDGDSEDNVNAESCHDRRNKHTR